MPSSSELPISSIKVRIPHRRRELITRTYSLDDINQGYADLDAGKNLRGVVMFDRPSAPAN